MIPFSLLRYHGAMLWVTCRIGLQFVFPSRKHTLPDIEPISQVIRAPSPRLVQHYLDWCDAADRYADTLPPHMVSHWGLPLVARILFKTPYPISKALNQGIALRIHGDLPRNQPLHCKAFVQSIKEESERTRISVTIQTGTAGQANLVEATLHMVIIHKRKNGKKKINARGKHGTWKSAGKWSTIDSDGLRFALITGDFNPIHWLGLAGKLSALKNKILHGFGTFARSYEQLGPVPIRHIDVRFLRPVPLPSAQLLVEQSVEPEDGKYRVRLRGADDQLHLAGIVTYR